MIHHHFRFQPLWSCCILLGAFVAMALPRGVEGRQLTVKELLAPEQIQGEEAVGGRAPLVIDPLDRSTPRRAMRNFLLAGRRGDAELMGRFLDVRRQTGMDAAALARQLRIVLDRKLWVDLDALSDDADGDTADKLPAGRDRVGAIATPSGPVDVLLQRSRLRSGDVVWRIAGITVAAIPALYALYGNGPLADILPPVFFEVDLFGVQLWEALWLGGLLFATYVLATVAARLATWLIRRRRGAAAIPLSDVMSGPGRLLLAVVIVHEGRQSLTLPIPVDSVLSTVEGGAVVLAIAWAAVRGLDVCARVVLDRFAREGDATAMALVPVTRTAARAAIAALAVIALLDRLGVDVTTVLAGLGIGGVALALAAQKTIENLIGGVTLFADRPVRVGDFCRFGETVGTVEEIGLRSTRVRTLERTVVTIPNAQFAGLQLENFGRRDRIWYHPRIGVRYETTPDQLRYILVEVRRMLYAHPKVDPTGARIRFVGFGGSSLDLDIFAYVTVTDFGEFLEVAEDLNLRIMDIVADARSSFAFPSQTLYVEPSQALDAERAAQAQRRVADWRSARELYLPRFPPEAIDRLRGTLSYPPVGSPSSSQT